MKTYEDFISSKEVSRITGYEVHTIRNHAREGRLKYYRPRPGSDMRFKRSEVEKFMQLGLKTKKKS